MTGMTSQAVTELPHSSRYAVSSNDAPRSSGRTLSQADVKEQAAAAPTLTTTTTEPRLNGDGYRLLSKGWSASRTDQFAIDDALVALRAAVQRDDEAGWLKASRLLRRSAIQENSRSPRFATLALVVSDALAFTLPAEVAPAAKRPLADAFDLLRQPFIPGDAEESVFQGLLDHGWRVTAPFDPNEWAGVAE
jgi:hypothetical protein